MKILIVGGGGREHAIGWKLSQSPHKPQLYFAPGNAGTGQIGENAPISSDDVDALLAFATKTKIDLTVVGPEDPLCAGIVDRFTKQGLRIFGPCAAAAKLEGDKAFAKKLMREASIPTAEARVFEPTSLELAQEREAGRDLHETAASPRYQTGYEMAKEFVATRDEGIVVKACGLAKGKGVFVHPDPADALRTIESLMVERSLGEAGRRIIVEELLIGREVSVMALVNGTNIYILETATDYKRLRDGNLGPNTGGMGAYSPSDLSDADLDIIQREVFVPIIDALARDEITYKGVLYAGLMLTAGGPKVLEFNCRFGDPETQPILMRLKNDLLDVFEATVDGRLDQITLEWDERSAVCVVMASEGYPGEYAKGKPIHGLDHADEAVFHSGTIRQAGEICTNGGRVLSVCALGEDRGAARERAYAATDTITFEGATFRGDIGE